MRKRPTSFGIGKARKAFLHRSVFCRKFKRLPTRHRGQREGAGVHGWNTRLFHAVSESMDSSLRSHVAAPTAKRLFVFGGVGLLVVAVVLLAYFGTEIRANERKASKGPAAIPVSVAPVLQEVVPLRLLAIGNVEAYATVSVKARVDGH